MRYFSNTIKSIINLLFDFTFFCLSMYNWHIKYFDHSKWDMLLYILTAIGITYTLDSICVIILSRKYNESGGIDILNNITNISNKEEKKD